MVEGGKSFGTIPEWVTRDLRRGRSGVDIAVQLIKKYKDIGFNSDSSVVGTSSVLP